MQFVILITLPTLTGSSFDEYGLYVIEEANIESHGLGYDLGIYISQ